MKTTLQKYLERKEHPAKIRTDLMRSYGVRTSVETLIMADDSAEIVWSYRLKAKKNRALTRMEKEINAILLDNDNEIVSCSFPKIFSLYSPNARKIDWNTAVAEEKLDGKLIMIYNHKGTVFIQTEESATAANPVPDTNVSYYEAIRNFLTKKFVKPFGPFNGKACEKYVWIFEFISSKNNTVKTYGDNLVLLGIIKKSMGQVELKSKFVDLFAEEYNFTRPQKFIVNSEEDAIKLHNEINNPYGPGIIITDKSTNRVKLVSNTFETIKRLTRDNVTEKHIAKAALTGFADDFYVRFEHYGDLLLLFDTTLNEIVEEIDNDWFFFKNSVSKKHFASQVSGNNYKRILFSMWEDKIEFFGDVLPFISAEELILETKRRHKLSYERAYDKFSKSMEVKSNV